MPTKDEYNELVKFRSGPIRRIEGPTSMIKHLVGQKYLKEVENDVREGFTILQIAWEITELGKAALARHEQYMKDRRKDNIRYAVTTAIAVAALIVAVASITLQAQLIELQVLRS